MNADLIGVWLEKLFTGMLLLIGSSLPCPGFQSKHLSVKISVLVCVPLHTFTIKFIECGLSQHELVPDASISLCFYIYIYIYWALNTPICPSIHPFVCSSGHTWIIVSICSSIWSSIHRSLFRFVIRGGPIAFSFLRVAQEGQDSYRCLHVSMVCWRAQ